MEQQQPLGGPGIISEAQRRDLQQRLVDNFHALLFHREGYRPCNVPAELIEQMASVVEAKAFLHVVRASELGMSGAAVQTYAKEAATLLLAEVERYTVRREDAPGGAAAGGARSGSSVDMQQLSLNEFSGGLRSIQTAPSHQARPDRPRDAAWGWLVPGSRVLPHVVLKGAGVAIGRGKEALWAVGGASSTPRSCLAGGASDRQLTEVLKRNLGFVEVADGRVSRLHCIISTGGGDGNGGSATAAGAAAGGGVALLEDCSSNGTFLNHRKLAKGESVRLEDGDRISLVLSVAPLVEQYFTYRSGDPRDPDAAGSDEWAGGSASHSASGVFSPGAVGSGGSPSGCGARPGSAAIFRTATSRYTTAEQSTLEDLRCQICLTTLRQCVALEPCGHNFCATCLSHHLGNQLQSGLQLSCPFRCPPPDRIIINYAVRALIDLLSSSGRALSGPLASRAGSMLGAAALAAAAGGGQGGSGQPRSTRAAMTGAFGAAAGSSNSLSGLAGGTPSAAHTSAQQQQQQQQGGSSSAEQPQQPQQQAAAGGGGGNSSSLSRAASAVSSFDAGGVAGSGLPGVAEEPADSSAADGGADGLGSSRSRFAAAAAAGSAPPPAAANGVIAAAVDASRAASGEPDFYTQSMNVLCPLDDDCLPMEAANLKTRQVEVALAQLKDTGLDHDDHLVCLEALARLAWSDDSVRQLVANAGGVRPLVAVMAQHGDSDSIQCNGCLALMSLVRGEGEVCQSNQWHVAKAGAIEVIAAAMQRFRDSAMVQLSVLLCLIPLTLENAMMQAHVTQECLADIMCALDTHIDEVDIQTKGLVLLGVLVQGDDALHDAVRLRLLEAGVPRRVGAALRHHGTASDDVLWAALFTLAVLVRDDSAVMGRAAGALVAAGVFRVLDQALLDYRQRHEDDNTDPDEMIISAGDYLLRVLEPVQQQADARRALLTAGAVVAGGVGAVLLLRRLWAGRQGASDGGGSQGGSSAATSLRADTRQLVAR